MVHWLDAWRTHPLQITPHARRGRRLTGHFALGQPRPRGRRGGERGVSIHDGPGSSLMPVSRKVFRQPRFMASVGCALVLLFGRVPYRTIGGNACDAPWRSRHLAVSVAHRRRRHHHGKLGCSHGAPSKLASILACQKTRGGGRYSGIQGLLVGMTFSTPPCHVGDAEPLLAPPTVHAHTPLWAGLLGRPRRATSQRPAQRWLQLGG